MSSPSDRVVVLDDGEEVTLVEDRRNACPAETTTLADGLLECWREKGHEGLHVQPCFDWLGRFERHKSPLWVWR